MAVFRFPLVEQLGGAAKHARRARSSGDVRHARARTVRARQRSSIARGVERRKLANAFTRGRIGVAIAISRSGEWRQFERNESPVHATAASAASAANHRRHHGTCRSRSSTAPHRVAPRGLHLRRRPRSARAAGGETASQPLGDLRRMRRQVDVAAQLPRENRRAVALAERRRAGERVRDDRGEREAVGRGVLLFAEQLLGRRERGRARRAGGFLAGRVGDAEVGEAPSTVAVDQDVLRLEVAVDDADRVRRARGR